MHKLQRWVWFAQSLFMLILWLLDGHNGCSHKQQAKPQTNRILEPHYKQFDLPYKSVYEYIYSVLFGVQTSSDVETRSSSDCTESSRAAFKSRLCRTKIKRIENMFVQIAKSAREDANSCCTIKIKKKTFNNTQN